METNTFKSTYYLPNCLKLNLCKGIALYGFFVVFCAIVFSTKQFSTPLLNWGRMFGANDRNRIFGHCRLFMYDTKHQGVIHELFMLLIMEFQRLQVDQVPGSILCGSFVV